MSNARLFQFLSGLILVGFTSLNGAQAQSFETWVATTGVDTADCTRLTPCQSFSGALGKTYAGGQINVLDSGDFGTLVITKSITIVNDTSGTASHVNGWIDEGGGSAYVVIVAGPNDEVTLRGLNMNGIAYAGGSTASAIVVNNAGRVNIEKCVIHDAAGPAILVAPNTDSQTTLATSVYLKIEDTVVTGSGGGARIASVPGVTVNASILRSSFLNNNGGGIRIDATSGGTASASISDTVSSMNAGNGIIAVSGQGGIAAAHITRSVMAANAAYGVQSNQTNGGAARMTVNSSTITTNVSGAVGFFGGAQLLTFGDNRIVGPNGTGFTGAVALQ